MRGEGLRSSNILYSVSLPKAIGIPERLESGFCRDTGTSEDEDVSHKAGSRGRSGLGNKFFRLFDVFGISDLGVGFRILDQLSVVPNELQG